MPQARKRQRLHGRVGERDVVAGRDARRQRAPGRRGRRLRAAGRRRRRDRCRCGRRGGRGRGAEDEELAGCCATAAAGGPSSAAAVRQARTSGRRSTPDASAAAAHDVSATAAGRQISGGGGLRDGLQRGAPSAAAGDVVRDLHVGERRRGELRADGILGERLGLPVGRPRTLQPFSRGCRRSSPRRGCCSEGRGSSACQGPAGRVAERARELAPGLLPAMGAGLGRARCARRRGRVGRSFCH